MLDVLVLSDAEQKLQIKNISDKDKLRFECKLLGTKQQFLGSVSFAAAKLRPIAPGESWSQLLPLFGEGESDEYRRDFGDVKVVPPCVLLTFQLAESSAPDRASAVQSRTVGQKAGTTKAAGPGSRGERGKAKGAPSTGAEKNAASLEERVAEAVDQLTGDMEALQGDDRDVVSRLDVLDSHHQNLQTIHENDLKKKEEVQKVYEYLMQAVNDMKDRDNEDIQELASMREQLDNDVNAASSDFSILNKDTKEFNDYISDKSRETYDSENGTVQSKHIAIRKFLLNTLQLEDERNQPIYQENEALRQKVNSLRNKVRDKFLNNQGASDDEINTLLAQYEDLLDEHAEAFKQLDAEANENVDEFEKHGDLWKKLFTEGMELEKKCDDVDYKIEDLADKEDQLRRVKADLENNYRDYVGKVKYVTEQQKGIIDELRNDINSLKSEINSLRRQHDSGTAELAVESVEFARGRNTKNDQNLENVVKDFIAVHKEKRREQDNGENLCDDLLEAHKGFLDNSLGEYKLGERDKGTHMRLNELMEQIFQSNQDIEILLADLQKLDRENGVNEHRTNLCNDINTDLADVRSRLEYELAQREKAIVELRDYARGDQREQFDQLIIEIQELRVFLRERWNGQQAELDDLKGEIDTLKERLKNMIREINELRIMIIEEEHHNDIKRNLLRNRDEYIERLKIAIAELENVKPEPQVEYNFVPGDDVDALFAQYLKDFGINIPLTRLGGGFYLFGTRKIYAKIMNGKLVVRVGGGYMVIDEFLRTYSDMELIRINKMLEKEGVEVYEELKVYKKYKDENPEAFKKIDPKKRTLIKSPKSKPKPSERGRF